YTANATLKIAKNKKAEFVFDLNIAKSLLRSTGFSEELIDGYSFSYPPSSFQPVDYVEYKRASANSPSLVGTSNPVLAKYAMPNNTARLPSNRLPMKLPLKRIVVT